MNLYLIALSTKYSDGWNVTFMRDVFTDLAEAESALDYYASMFVPSEYDAFPKCISIIDVAPVLVERAAEADAEDAAELFASQVPEDSETLGPCGCVDYHMADCPTRTPDSFSAFDLDEYYERDERHAIDAEIIEDRFNDPRFI